MLNSSVICIIPARGGSKGIKRKNLKLVNGISLIHRTINDAKASGVVDTILVSTDDKEIAQKAKDAGAEVPFIRPKDLSEDLSTTEETLQHALLTYESLTSKKFDICVFLAPTNIFRNKSWIKEVVHKLLQNPDLESVFVGYKSKKNYWEKDSQGKWTRLRPWMASYSSRQIRESIIREDTGIACASRADLWRKGRRIGDNVEIITNDDSFTFIDIHEDEDLRLADSAIKIRSES